MAGKKRAAEDDAGAGPTTRSAKNPKTTESAPAARGRRGSKKGPKTNMAASTFKARALPLHVNLTHTPPAIPDEDTVNIASTDPGFIGTTTLVPSTFATGSYGWKGNKRLTIELQNGEGEKEKVHVMLTINATVMGSKGAKEDAEPEDGETKDEHVDEEAAENGATVEAEAEGKAAEELAAEDKKDE